MDLAIHEINVSHNVLLSKHLPFFFNPMQALKFVKDVLFSKGGGVRFLRYLLGTVNIYLPPGWVVFKNEVYLNRAQLRSETIPEGKYIPFQNSFFPPFLP